MPKSLFFLSLLFGGKTQSYWLPVSPVAPSPPLSFNPISPPFRNALQSFFCTRLPFFSRPLCPRQSGGSVCVWLPQIYSSSLVKQDTVTSSVSGGPHPRLLSAKCQRPGTCERRRGNSMADQEESQERTPVGHHR